MPTRIIVWMFIGIVAGCSALEPKGTSVAPEGERFTRIEQSAQLANAAYQDTEKIEKISADSGYQLVKHEVVPGVDVQYFLSRHPVTQAQLISVRGTANLMKKYKHIPITRVVNEKDMVPLVPHFEATLSALPSLYWHMGEEIVLFPGDFYSSLSATERDLDAHKMAVYWSQFASKNYAL